LLQAIRDYSSVLPGLLTRDSARGHTILARANARFPGLIKVFLQNCRDNVVTMRVALDRGDFATIELLGHSMRGAGGMYGSQAITDIGAGIELAAEITDRDVCRRWVNELSLYLERVEIVAEVAPPPA
jgi:HPt (histidine-containing phosphotransfer) domain-containing protein